MVEASSPERLFNVCAAYQRDVALAHIDIPLGTGRDARLAELLGQCAEYCSGPALAELRGLLAEAPAVARASLQRLQAWGLLIHMQAALLPQHRELQERQRTAMCVVDEEVIPLLASFAAMAHEKRRDRRATIDAAVGEQLLLGGLLEQRQRASVGLFERGLQRRSVSSHRIDEVAHDRQRDIGFEQRDADLAHRARDIVRAQRAVPAQPVEDIVQAIAESVEHGRKIRS